MKLDPSTFSSPWSLALALRRCAAGLAVLALLQSVSCVAPSNARHARGRDEEPERPFVRGGEGHMQRGQEFRGDDGRAADMRSGPDGGPRMREPMPERMREPMDGRMREPMDGRMRAPMDGRMREPMDGRMRAPMPERPMRESMDDRMHAVGDGRGGPGRFGPRRGEFRGRGPFGPPPPFLGRRGPGPDGPPPEFAPRFERGQRELEFESEDRREERGSASRGPDTDGPGALDQRSRGPGSGNRGQRDDATPRGPGMRGPGPFARRPFGGAERLDDLDALFDELDLTPAQRDRLRDFLERRRSARIDGDLRLPEGAGEAGGGRATRRPGAGPRVRRELDPNDERDDTDDATPPARRPRGDVAPRTPPRERERDREPDHRGEV